VARNRVFTGWAMPTASAAQSATTVSGMLGASSVTTSPRATPVPGTGARHGPRADFMMRQSQTKPRVYMLVPHLGRTARPAGRQVAREVEAAILDAGRRLADAGWTVEEIADTPPLNEAAEVNEWLWLGDGFAQLADEAERDGDPGALAVVAAVRPRIKTYPAGVVGRALLQRATVLRQWQLFLNKYAVLLIPVSAELPFPDGLDLQGNAAIQRVWDAQFLLRATPVLGLPALTVSTGLVGQSPVGVQIVAGRYREDLCLRAGEAIEARGTPPAPIDPRN
jgi:amidase